METVWKKQKGGCDPQVAEGRAQEVCALRAVPLFHEESGGLYRCRLAVRGW